ncbi:MAG: amidohydrolase [Planctomycetota bacterium]|nr:amidohydrolase [Planctomycetota bacterium]MDA1211919.1 amidohydrolase [Planctomycetota bacterium]
MPRTLLVLTLLLISSTVSAASPDLILHHGKVVTVDHEFSIVEAFAVTGDRISAVGTNDEILKLKGPETILVDAEGKCVIPGLIDSHVHATGASLYEFDHPIPEMDTIADVLQHIAYRTTQVQEGDWIILSQVFITRLRDQRYPTRNELDRVAPKNPVMFRTGPDCALNSLALELSGIDKNFTLPEGSTGLIERDESGEPTGILRNASGYVKTKSNERSPNNDERRERLRLLLADYNSVGLTSIADRGAGEGAIALYKELFDRGELTCRVFMSYTVSGSAPIEEIEKQIQKAADHPLHAEDRWLWVRGIKAFLDGGMLTGSAYMREPWGVSDIYSIRDPEYRGIRFIPSDKLEHMARYALEHDLQFTAHSVGDGAVHALIDAYTAINETLPVRDLRPCITHCNFMSAEAIAQMKKIGVVADLQPAWLWLDGATLERQFGSDRLAYFQPYKSMFDAGVFCGGGSDHMQKIGSLRSVNPYNPFLAMWITITREPRRLDHVFHPEQCLSREQALRLYTINNAYLTFEEQHKGSLEVGKLADFAILNDDLLTCPEERIREITVHKTYVGGSQVYAEKVNE